MSAKTKTCTKCKEKRKIEEFSKDSKRNGEPRAICKICDRKSSVERRRRIADGKDSTSKPSGGKACQSCKQHKPLSGFPQDKNRVYRDSCKPCYAREVEAAQIAERNATEKKCGKCEKVKPIDAFSKDSSKATGYRSACRECMTKDRHERKKRQEKEGRKPVSKPQAATPRVVKRATRKKKVVLVTMTVPDDKLGTLEADAHRYALRQLVQGHSAEYENLRLNFEATNGKYLTTLIE